MRTTRLLYLGVAAVGIAALIAACAAQMGGEQSTGAAVRIDNDDIGGVVTSAKGPEAGVWVIAETTELSTRFAKMVVTDDQGRYVVPDLPKAGYDVWVRGYGLVDSPKVKAAPGAVLDLRAVAAPDARAAAQYYPAGYWFSLLRVPDKSAFTGAAAGTGVASRLKSRAERRRWRSSRIGRTASRRASCRRPPRGRRGWSATSSSRNGTGPIRRPTFTTRSRPTATIPPRMRTARSTARWS